MLYYIIRICLYVNVIMLSSLSIDCVVPIPSSNATESSSQITSSVIHGESLTTYSYIVALQITIRICMHTCMHTHLHTYVHACMHTYVHAYIHTYIHAYIHAYCNLLYFFIA